MFYVDFSAKMLHFHVEKDLGKNIVSGEKMTNMRYAVLDSSSKNVGSNFWDDNWTPG